MAIANFPTPTDDSGDGESGTPVDLAWVDELEAAIEAVVKGTDNPNTAASEIIDEVIEARGSEETLAENIEALTQGADNPDVQAPAIIDEVVAARDGEVDLLTRVTREASVTEPGEVSISAQEFNGLKTFDDGIVVQTSASFEAHPTFEPGTSSGTNAPMSGVIYADATPRPGSSTTETDASTYTLPANVLSANGKALRILAWGKSTSTGTHTYKIFWNGSSIITPATNAVAGSWFFEVIVMRTSATTQTAICKGTTPVTLGVNTATPAVILSYPQTVWDNLAATLSGTVAIKSTVQDSADGAQVVQLGFLIEVLG